MIPLYHMTSKKSLGWVVLIENWSDFFSKWVVLKVDQSYYRVDFIV